MKKLLLATLLGAGITANLYAADGDTFTYGGLTYTVLSETDLTCEVGKNANAIAGAVVIPSHVVNDGKEYTVTALGESAFALDTRMTSISIPETVTVIKREALTRVFSITELVIPNSVTEMGERAVYGCNSLRNITLSSSCREILHETFSGNAWLEGIVIPDGVEVIQNEAFNYCSRAKYLTLGSTLTSIGKMAFAGWNNLEELTVPANVNELAEEAFSYCYKLATVTFEESTTPIRLGINVFGQGIYAGNMADDPVAKIVTLTLNRPWTCPSSQINEMPFAKKLWLQTVNIGPAATSLPNNTFANCNSIKAVNVASGTCPAAVSGTFPLSAYNNAILTVPESAVEAYKSHAVWSQFLTIEGSKETQNAIATIAADDARISDLYDLNGRKITSAPASGIYIVRLTDGTLRKLIVR